MLQNKFRQHGWKGLLAFILLAALLIGCGNGESKKEEDGENAAHEWIDQVEAVDLGVEGDTVIASYKEGTVKASEFEKYLNILFFFTPQSSTITNPENWPKMLETYTGDKILLERASAQGIKEDKEEVDNIYNEQKAYFVQSLQGDEAFQKYLEKLKLTETDVQNFIKQYHIIDKYLASHVDENQLKSVYEQSKENYTIATVRHILISNENRSDEEAKKLAEELADRIKKGEDFAELAKEYSEDPGSKDNGGLYEKVNVNNWVEEFKNAAIELPLNEVSDPVKTNYGYHVMRVEERSVQPFEEVKETLVSAEIYNQYNTFVNDELPGLIVETNLPEPKKTK